MTYEELKESIAEVIKTNGNQEITGDILQNVLKGMVDNLAEHIEPKVIVMDDIFNPTLADKKKLWDVAVEGKLINTILKYGLYYQSSVISVYFDGDNLRVYFYESADGEVIIHYSISNPYA